MITTNEDVLLRVIDALCQKTGEKVKKLIYNNKEFDRVNSYSYIPIRSEQFFRSILIVKEALNFIKPFGRDIVTKKPRPTFVDYGAGIGGPMYFATQFGFHAYGIEIDDNCLNNCITSNCKHDTYTFELEKGDLTDDTVFIDKSYDVVYYYCPFISSNKELEFELKAIKTVKVGGYIIAPYPGRLSEFYKYYKNKYIYGLDEDENKTKFYNKMKNFEHVQDDVYKRIK